MQSMPRTIEPPCSLCHEQLNLHLLIIYFTLTYVASFMRSLAVKEDRRLKQIENLIIKHLIDVQRAQLSTSFLFIIMHNSIPSKNQYTVL